MKGLIIFILFTNIFFVQSKPSADSNGDPAYRILPESPEAGQSLGPRRDFAGISDFTDIPFIATLLSTVAPKMFGNGVVLGPHWALFRAREISKIQPNLNKTFIHIAVVNWGLVTPGDNGYKIMRMIPHPDYVAGEIDYDIALFKVCHRMDLNKYATIPGPGTLYVDYKLVDVICDQEGPIGYGSMMIYQQSLCSPDFCPTHDVTKHYITRLFAEDGWEPNADVVDYGAPFAMRDNDFHGFIVGFQKYESFSTLYFYAVQRAQVYKSWVDTTITA